MTSKNSREVSRLWGGYHIRADNEQGLILGRQIAMYSWPIYRSYFDGTAAASGERQTARGAAPTSGR